jgi:hypothetical protein
MQKSFSDLEYAAKKKLTRRDRFLAKIDEVTPWSQLHVTWHVAMKRAKRKALPNNKLGRQMEKLEHLKASVRES